MTRPIPRKLLPHVDSVSVSPVLGASAAGRSYGPEAIIPNTLIIDGTSLVGTQYEREAAVVGVVYFDRDALDTIPAPDSRVKLWHGDRDEHEAFVKRTERYKHPRLGDVLVMVLR